MTRSPAVTLLMPTRNAGPEFPRVLDRLQSQRLDRPYELLAIDSGSTDGTLERLEATGVRVIRIAPDTFNHGATRNLGIREARGEVVVLTVQDALPADDEWLQQLVRCFDDPRVAGAYSRQLPRPDANPFIRSRLAGWPATWPAPRAQSIPDAAAFAALPPLEKLATVTFDNVSSSVRRSVALEHPFRPLGFGEDVEWAHRVLLAGHTIIYEPASCVIHSHNRSLGYEFRRVYADHRQLHALFGVETVPHPGALLWRSVGGTWALLKAVAGDPGLGPLARLSWGARTLPYAFGQTLAQYLGARAARGLARGSRFHAGMDRILSRGV